MNNFEINETYKAAIQKAVKILSRKMMSEKMLRDKLIDFEDDVLDYVIKRMRDIGAVDDTAYADAFIRTYQKKGYGTYKIKYELMQRGISGDILENALNHLNIDYEKALKLLNNKFKDGLSDFAETEKAKALLFRRGFTNSDILKIIEIFGQEANI